MNNIFDIKFLLVLYLVQLSSLTSNTLGKQLKEYVESNRISQHIINLLFLFVLISIADKTKSIQNIAINAVSIYLFYLLSTKLDLQYNIILLSLILIYYLYQRNNDSKINRINNDNYLDIETKKMLTLVDNNKNNIFGCALIIFLFYFTHVYFKRKNIQYGNGFNYSKFLLY
jgi:hypothetical protein